ncbi:hypothetical protein MBAV_002700, partial [Candidatus Magnetobacterium bavaricum]
MESHKVEIFSVDESHFSNEPYVQRGWFPIGYKKSLWTTEKREQDYLRSIKY